MNAVDQIIEKARVAIREFEVYAEKHQALIERSLDADALNHSWWLASLTDEEDRILTRHGALRTCAERARTTLKFWNKEV